MELFQTQRSRRIGLIVFLVVIVLVGAYATTSYIFSSSYMFLNRQPLTKTPADYGMEYEDVTFEANDRTELSGWLIPGDGEGVVIVTHAGGFTRQGFLPDHQPFPPMTDLEVDLIKTHKALHDDGYTVLAFDFRNHGESGQTEDGLSGIGLEEYKDVLAAMEFISTREDLVGEPLGFVSFCMGANSTIIANSKQPGVMAPMKALVAIQPISSDVLAYSFAGDRYSKPLAWLLIPGVEAALRMRGGYSLYDMSPVEYAKDLDMPTLFVQYEHDSWTDLSDIRTMHENAIGYKELWLIPDLTERFDTYNYMGEEPDRMLDFLGVHVREEIVGLPVNGNVE